ncbi:MAG: UvrD-helicase domain-containing protein [Pseudomonadota bacterium]
MNEPAFTLDGTHVSREAFYAAACDPRRAVVVEACAGAGKTWMLVSRIVRALLDGAEPQQILAITFTRKAAGEMRTRLAEWLQAFARLDHDGAVGELQQRGLDRATAEAQAAALIGLHERVLASGRAVEVRTFHAWFSQLLRAAPLDLLADLGLRPDLQLIEDLDDLQPALMHRFHTAVLADEALLADYRALAASRGRTVLQKWLDAAWQRRIEVELADEAQVLEASVETAAEVFPECDALAHPAALVRRLPFVTAATQLARQFAARHMAKSNEAAREIEAALAEADDEAAFKGLWSALFTKEDSPKKQLGDLPAQAELCAMLERIGAAIEQHVAHHEHARMLRLSRVLFATYAELKHQRGLIDMVDLERVALALLADHALAGWVQQRLDARVRHLLIDEFQDTSPLQWHALHAWLSSYAGAGAGAVPSLFIVGDPKQSIYRFRRAEPRVFEAAQCFVVEGLGGTLAACDHTRRNAPAVLAAINRVFGALSAEGALSGWREHSTQVAAADAAAPAVFTLPSALRERTVPRARNEASVERVWRDSLTMPRHEPETVLREIEAAAVAQAVQELIHAHGIDAGQIYVLARKRASLRLAAEALRALQLPYVAPEEVALAELPEVLDLLAVLDVLASSGQALSLARALKSPLFGVGDDELLQLSVAARETGGWWPALMQGRVDTPALARARTLFGAWQGAATQLPPHDLLDRIVHEGDLIARIAATVPAEHVPGAIDAVQSLLACALELDGARYATPYNFVRALRRRRVKAVPAARADAVQLLTIHGAKGLEARVVFVMDSEPEAQPGETATLLIDWPVQSARPRRVAFIASESRCPPSLRPLLAIELAARQREEINGLYVAMTRAQERLVFSRTPPHRGASTLSWWHRVEASATPWQPAAPAATNAAACSTQLVDLPLDRPARPVGASPASTAMTEDTSAARLGRAVHRMLEWAAATDRPDPDRLAQAAAMEFGVADVGAVRTLGRRILGSAACARFFDPGALSWAGNEVPVAGVGADGRGGPALRIDRLVRTAGEAPTWWVLDYKLQGRPQDVPAYREQLAAYRMAVQALQPGEQVRAAFISGQGELIEPD